MKTSRTWNFRSIVSNILLGLVLVTMIGSIDVTPAFGKDNHERMEQRDNGRHRGHRYNRDRYVVHDRRVYVPPPVVYVEPPAPGIQIFFPPLFIHP